MKNEGKLKRCDSGTCFILQEEDNLHEHLKVIWLLDDCMLFFCACENALTLPTCEL
jgi:hypothetical protein